MPGPARAILPVVPDDLTSTAGIVALVAAGLALLTLTLTVILALRLRRMRTAQTVVLGESGQRDLVTHAQSLQGAFDDLHGLVDAAFQKLHQRLAGGEQRLDHCLSRSAVIRYDAYGEMTGRQSSSIALLDDTGSGVVLSSILHREQARMYVKAVRGGRSELDLSPEENEAIRNALAERG